MFIGDIALCTLHIFHIVQIFYFSSIEDTLQPCSRVIVEMSAQATDITIATIAVAHNRAIPMDFYCALSRVTRDEFAVAFPICLPSVKSGFTQAQI